MSGSRIMRSTRLRALFCMLLIVMMFGMVAVFHSQQQQLDEYRTLLQACEHDQESMNSRLRTMIELKLIDEKTYDRDRSEQMLARRDLEQKLKGQMALATLYDKLVQTHKSLQAEHAGLVSSCAANKKQQLEDANALERKVQSIRAELQKEKNVQSGEVTLWQEKYNTLVREKERQELLLNATNHVQQRVLELEQIVSEYQTHCAYKLSQKNDSKPLQTQQQQQINKPLNTPDTTRNANRNVQQGFDKPRHNNDAAAGLSFNEQVLVGPGLYHLSGDKLKTNITWEQKQARSSSSFFLPTVNATNNNLKNTSASSPPQKVDSGAGASLKLEKIQHLLPFSARNNRSLIINSVENFQIVPKPIKKLSEETETQLKQQPDDSPVAHAPAAAALVAADSAAVKMASPLSAPRRPTSTEATKSEHQQQALEANAHLKQAVNSTATSASSSSSSLAPLAMPLPKQAKQLPANVAPIPANFEQLLQQNEPKAADTAADKLANGGGAGDAADIDAAVEDMQQKNENENDEEGNNNRYAHVVNDLEGAAAGAAGQKAAAHKAAANEDSGAHEIKDHDFMNDQNFNLPAGADDDNNNFFENGVVGRRNNAGGGASAGGDAAGGAAAEKHKDEDNEDDDVMGGAAGVDIAVKNPNHLLDAENLNNEVAGDQGKELFPDGLRLEDGNDEDEDEDDYSNPAARQQGAQAIRN